MLFHLEVAMNIHQSWQIHLFFPFLHPKIKGIIHSLGEQFYGDVVFYKMKTVCRCNHFLNFTRNEEMKKLEIKE